MKSRIKDLQSYKNDVSKTFKILDNELLLINDHLKRQSNLQSTPMSSMSPMSPMSPMSSMSPMNIGLSRISSFNSSLVLLIILESFIYFIMNFRKV